MPKSSRFQPGDSAPDFSHLDDHDPDSDETQWPPGDAPLAGDAEDLPARDQSAEASQSSAPDPRSSRDEAHPKSPGEPAGDSHVFFEADEPVNDDELAGETTAYAPPHQQPAAATGDSSRAARQDEVEADSVLDAAPDADDPPLRVSAENATQLTDVGIPVFQDPPGISAEDAEDAAAAPSAAGSDEPAAASASSTAEAADEDAAAPQFVDVETVPVPASSARAEPSTSAAAKRTSRSQAAARPQRNAASAPPVANDRQRLLLILLASYASAMTLAFLWLWMTRSTARPHELESLPDVAPLGPNEFRYAPQNASMPDGHTLPLGSQQQLGHIRVEPLRVTRGPVQFAHYSDPTQSKPPTEPVLKLWLRFTNVSSDQLIAPLDAQLLLTRSYQIDSDSVLANQLLLPAEKASHKPAYVIDHPTTSEWDLAGQQLGHRLKPGESLETYIPLEPGSDAHLDGDLLWRVHFRKGYHDATGHGVTTMIEVPFSTADVQTESATAS